MQDIRPREVRRGGSGEPPRVVTGRVALGAAMLCLILAGQGCSSITTPLPTTHPTVTSSISQADRKKEMEELQNKAASHEADAERQIENSR
jgi:hypothetical protein